MLPPNRLPAFLLLLLSPLWIGCGGGNDGKPEETTSDAIPAADTVEFRETMEGNWVMKITELIAPQGQQVAVDVPVGLVVVSNTKSGLTADVIETSVHLEGVEFEVADLTERSIRLRGESDDESVYEIVASLEDGDLRGTLLEEGSPLVKPIRFLPTTDESLAGIRPEIATSFEVFDSALKTQSVSRLESFAEERPRDALSLIARRVLVAMVDADDRDEALKKFGKTSAIWGERLVEQAPIEAALMLSAVDETAAAAESLLDAAVPELDEERADAWSKTLEQVREGIRAGKARVALRSDEEQVWTEAQRTLEELLAADPSDPQLALALAKHADRQDRADDAIRLYAELEALPSLSAQLEAREEKSPRIRARLTELWKDKHGHTKGLDDYLDEVYTERVHYFVEEPHAPLKRDRPQVALVELFTGLGCPPCVAADIALSGLADTYETTDLVTLQYHLHSAGANPLVNRHTEARAVFYGVSGSPTTFLNGESVAGVAGISLSSAAGAYERLVTAADAALESQTDVTIELSTNFADGRLQLLAEAKGFDAGDENLRLRTVIAESEIHHPSRNGIRIHEMVVRWMPGSADGIEIDEDGRLVLDESLDLAALRDELSAYLAAYERANGVEFSRTRPPRGPYHFVAFVQNDETQSVLQAASVPLASLDSASPAAEVAGSKDSDDETVSTKESDETPVSTEAQPRTDAEGDPEAEDGDDAVADRETTAGRWIVTLPRIARGPLGRPISLDFPVALVDVTHGEDGWKAEVLETTGAFGDVELEPSKVTESTLILVGDDDEGDAHTLVARLADGLMRGAVVVEGVTRVLPTQLRPTEAMSLDDAEPEKTDGFDEFWDAYSSNDVDALKDFITENEANPLSVTAGRIAVGRSEDGDTQESVERLVKVAAGWGDPLANYIQLEMGTTLVGDDRFVDLGEKLLDVAVPKLDDERTRTWKPSIDKARDTIKVARARLALQSEDVAERNAARSFLEKMYAASPTDPRTTYALAGLAVDENRTEDALRMYAEIVALPFMQLQLTRAWPEDGVERDLPEDLLAELWKRDGRDENALEAFVDGVYHERIHFFAPEPEKRPAPGERNRVALLELFTGVECPPCVVADVTIGALAETYGDSELVLLQFHQHIPGPDPLTIPASDNRAERYGARGTPTALLNGKRLPPLGGATLDGAAAGYESLSEAARPALDLETDVVVDVSTKVVDGKIEIAARAKGFDAENENLELRVVLAETEVRHIGRNGVRFHEMVARWMPDAVALKDGKLQFEGTIEPGAVAQEQSEYLDAFGREIGRPFAVKSLPHGAVRVVAFVQDAKTNEVLQTAVTDVEGQLDFSFEAEKPESDENETGDEESTDEEE